MLLKLALISFKNKAYFLVEFWLHNKMLHAIRIEIVNTFSQCRGQVLKKMLSSIFFLLIINHALLALCLPLNA